MFFDHSKVNFTIGLKQQNAGIKEGLTVSNSGFLLREVIDIHT